MAPIRLGVAGAPPRAFSETAPVYGAPDEPVAPRVARRRLLGHRLADRARRAGELRGGDVRAGRAPRALRRRGAGQRAARREPRPLVLRFGGAGDPPEHTDGRRRRPGPPGHAAGRGVSALLLLDAAVFGPRVVAALVARRGPRARRARGGDGGGRGAEARPRGRIFALRVVVPAAALRRFGTMVARRGRRGEAPRVPAAPRMGRPGLRGLRRAVAVGHGVLRGLVERRELAAGAGRRRVRVPRAPARRVRPPRVREARIARARRAPRAPRARGALRGAAVARRAPRRRGRG
mmetsp:Transcript_19169/g.59019  ORF Transcript_19169/g.59019 Transcript_19169/m.59019 type:complete len:292 (+) Transcript_19169:376-1251(+)